MLKPAKVTTQEANFLLTMKSHKNGRYYYKRNTKEHLMTQYEYNSKQILKNLYSAGLVEIIHSDNYCTIFGRTNKEYV